MGSVSTPVETGLPVEGHSKRIVPMSLLLFDEDFFILQIVNWHG
jgi:hypothetical protein